jgi:gliding motility-associated-like protein
LLSRCLIKKTIKPWRYTLYSIRVFKSSIQLGKLHHIVFLMFIVAYCKLGKAQNLVKNPSFENLKSCPFANYNFNWYVNDWWGLDTSSAAIFNTCGAAQISGVPSSSYGYQYPRTGNSHASIILMEAGPSNSAHNGRSYIQGTFTQPLVKDSIYCVNYWVCLGFNVPGMQIKSVKNVDAYINDTLLNWNNGMFYNLIGFTPQITSPHFLTDTLNWMPVSGFYKAHGGEMHITIGNFKNYNNTPLQILEEGNGNGGISYFIDDVSVSPFTLQPPKLGNDTTVCQNNLPMLLTAPLGYDSITWSTGATTQTINVMQAGTYWVKCTSNGCGSLTDTIKIKMINSLPTTALKDTVLCQNQGALILNAPIGFASYLWSNGATTQSLSINQTGTYYVTANDACSTFKDTVLVTINNTPPPPMANDTSFCQFNSNAHIIINGQAIKWYQNANDTVAITAPTFNTQLAQLNNYYMTQTINNCESDKDTVRVTIFPIPEIALAPDTMICETKSASIGVPYNPLYFYLWNTNQTSSYIIADTSGLYTLQVKNNCGEVNKSIQVTYENCDKCLFIPNAFTPNNDGLNDEFEVKTVCPIEFYNLKIYNRWGQKIAEYNSPQAKWSGEKNNITEKQDVYVYVIDVTYNNHTTEHYVGHVTLLK